MRHSHYMPLSPNTRQSKALHLVMKKNFKRYFNAIKRELASLSTDRFIDNQFIDRPFYRQPVYRQTVLSTTSLSTDRFIDNQFIDRPFYRQPVYRQTVLSTANLSTLPFDRHDHLIDKSILSTILFSLNILL